MGQLWRSCCLFLLRDAVSLEPKAPSAHPKVPGFHNFRPELMLPDYDCHFLPESWWNMVTDFFGSLELLGITGSARASGYETLEGELEIWNNYAGILADRPVLARDCPFANFMGRISLWTCCKIIEQLEKSRPRPASKGAPDYCEELRTDPVMLSRELLGSGEEHLGLRTSEHLVVFLNSRFSQHFHAWVQRSKNVFQFMNIVLNEDLDCQSAVDVPSEWDWPGYLERVSEEASNQEELEIEGAVIFAMNTRATKDMNQKLAECPLGMLSILAHQLEVGLGMLTEQISMGTYLMAFALNLIETQLKSPDWLLRALLQSRWPFFTKLASSALLVQARNSWLSPARYQNKPYKLDFLPSELLYPLDERHQLPHGTTSAALKLRRVAWRRSESYAQLMRALQTSLEHAPALRGRHVVMFTLVYGARYAGYLPRWIQRAVAFGHGARTLLFCLDENTVKVCQSHHPFPALCVAGEVKTTANKFHFTSVVINSGFDVLYLDFDTIFFKDPLPPVLQAAEKAEMLLTRDFGTECINIGVVFMKSHPANAQFMEDLIIWLWHHPYEFCQKAFAGVMGLEDVQWNSLFGDIVRSVPRWAFLDSLNAFVTSTIYGEGAMGWTGREDQIVIYHFLDGTGGVDSSISVRGYVNLFDLFYANDRLNLSETETPLYVQDPQIQAQLDFSRLEGPVQLQVCSHLEEAAFPAWKLRQRHDLRNRRDIRPIELS